MQNNNIQSYIQAVKLPKKNSHKGQNGKLLVIGGSDLFHAASAWSLEAASKIVDLVLYSSVTENNEHIVEAKKNFWNGIVVPRQEVEQYVEEADCILIGPGMMRKEEKPLSVEEIKSLTHDDIDWQHDTNAITNYLLSKYPLKKWVIDAGALQMVNPKLFTKTMIITPHTREFERLFGKNSSEENAVSLAMTYQNVTILLKGHEDIVTNGDKTERVYGGNEGMTKGGTGDVLAGIVAALYCTNDAFTSAVCGSYVNKMAGDLLYVEVGPFFNATDLLNKIPKTLHTVFGNM